MYIYVYIYICVCMYIYIYVCVYICIYMCMFIHVFVSIYIYVYIYTVCVYLYIYMCVYIYIYIHTHTCIYMYIYIYTQKHVYTYTYIYIYMHIYICIFMSHSWGVSAYNNCDALTDVHVYKPFPSSCMLCSITSVMFFLFFLRESLGANTSVTWMIIKSYINNAVFKHFSKSPHGLSISSLSCRVPLSYWLYRVQHLYVFMHESHPAAALKHSPPPTRRCLIPISGSSLLRSGTTQINFLNIGPSKKPCSWI